MSGSAPTTESVTAVARAALADPAAVVADVDLSPVGYRIINAITEQLVRARGVASDGRAWSAFGKLIRRGAVDVTSSTRHFSASDDPRHWNYWRREALAYRDGVAGRLAPGLRAPRLLALEETPDTAWVWLEDVDGTPGRDMSPERAADLGRALGRWQGAVAAAGPVDDRGWLSRDWLAAFIPASAGVEPHLDADSPVWSHPAVRRHLSAADARQLQRLWTSRAAVVDAARRCPASLAHLDVWAANVLDDGHDLVLLDWSSVGSAALGTDLANLVNDSVWMLQWPAERLDALDEALPAAYLSGAADAGWSGDPELVTGAYAAAVALHFAPLVGGLAGLAFDTERRALTERNFGVDPDDALDRRAAVVAHAITKIDAALALPLLVSARRSTGAASRSAP
jgi:hypothetical protein